MGDGHGGSVVLPWGRGVAASNAPRVLGGLVDGEGWAESVLGG